jgi:hypothetical protein
MAQAESVALALAERLFGSAPADADALLAAVALDGLDTLRKPCPKRSAAQCWEEPLALPVFGGDLDVGRRALAHLEDAGVTIRRARSALACVRVYNRLLRRHGSKLEVDLALFERLLLDAREALGQEATCICGMVGGIRRYGPRFSAFRRRVEATLEEARHRAAYRIAGVGEVAFEVDSDAKHLPVGLASMLGKYLRELAMERQNRFYRRRQPDLPAASGYHDPVTRRFVDESGRLRRRLRISEGCFLRAR